ncbi:MAG: amino acid ABC transporter permease [bacterium]|nr:amino acid ABC transporter permease [bacterium]
MNFIFEKIALFLLNIGDSFYQSVIYDNRYKFIIEGLVNTIVIAFFAVIIGIIIGVAVALIRNYHEQTGKLKFANVLSKMYVSVIRGTPVILQLMIIYYVIFKSVNINIILVGILAFGINSGAYVSEIIRAGINSIPIGQLEAGYSLGLKYGQVMKYIILPQAIKNILPALGNEFITLLKETSVGAYIGIIELTKASDIIASRTYDYFFPLIIIAFIYLIMTLGLSKVVNLMEVRLNNVRG